MMIFKNKNKKNCIIKHTLIKVSLIKFNNNYSNNVLKILKILIFKR